jgi:hypothetical protein
MSASISTAHDFSRGSSRSLPLPVLMYWVVATGHRRNLNVGIHFHCSRFQLRVEPVATASGSDKTSRTALGSDVLSEFERNSLSKTGRLTNNGGRNLSATTLRVIGIVFLVAAAVVAILNLKRVANLGMMWLSPPLMIVGIAFVVIAGRRK